MNQQGTSSSVSTEAGAVSCEKRSRKSYTRDEKLKVVARIIMYQTSKHFKISTKNVLRWVKDEEKIKDSIRGSR